MFKNLSERLQLRAAHIKLLVFDIDGVLTDGSIMIGEQGELVKRFYAMDGHGIKLALQFGLELAVISGRESIQTHVRCEDLGMTDIYTGVENKIACLDKLIEEKGLTYEDVAFIGDDSIDISILEKVGLSVCPPESHYSVFKHVHYITDRKGGYGAAREFIDLILYCQNKIPE
jgi:3-deoxy-D-manno-octulosonate 8-phosphate phosphatase (KDO 8-P phosphatase)